LKSFFFQVISLLASSSTLIWKFKEYRQFLQHDEKPQKEGYITDLSIEVNSAIGFLHFVDLGNVASVLEVHPASVSMVNPKGCGNMYLRNISNTSCIQTT
jgi:hypothetical protein